MKALLIALCCLLMACQEQRSEYVVQPVLVVVVRIIPYANGSADYMCREVGTHKYYTMPQADMYHYKRNDTILLCRNAFTLYNNVCWKECGT